MTEFAPSHIIVGLPYPNLNAFGARRTLELAREFGASVKLELPAATRKGYVKPLKQAHKFVPGRVFWDLKLHHTEDTVRQVLRDILPHGPMMVDIHADSPDKSLEAFIAERNAAAPATGVHALAVAVTELTSMTAAETYRRRHQPRGKVVRDLARRAMEYGFDGVVCAPRDLAALHSERDLEGLLKVVTGVRHDTQEPGQQSNALTPRRAVEMGADFIVVDSFIAHPPEDIGSYRQAFEAIFTETETARTTAYFH